MTVPLYALVAEFAGPGALLGAVRRCRERYADVDAYAPYAVDGLAEALGFSRNRVPLAYDPVYWSMVFPLGMYTAATYRLAGALDFPALLPIPRLTFFAAMACWLVTFAGLVGRSLKARPAPGNTIPSP